MKKFISFLKTNNGGLSMVELICAIAIVSLLGTTVAGMMAVSANSYRRGSAETDVQQEAQLIANQISDLIIDVTSSVAYDETQKLLTIKQDDEQKTELGIQFDLGTKAVYYTQTITKGDGSTEVDGPQLMAENVTAFVPDVNDYNDKGFFKIRLDIEKDSHSYSNYFTITSRNATCLADGSDVAEQVKVILNVTRWLGEPNQLIPIDGFAESSDSNFDVLWMIGTDEAYDADTQIVDDDTLGTCLKIGNNENKNAIRLVATAGNSDPAVVTVSVRRVTKMTAAAVALPGTGTSFVTNDRYELVPTFFGNNLAQKVGAEYDLTTTTDRSVKYMDPHEILCTPLNGTALDKIDLTGNVVKLTGDFAANDYVVIRVTAAHAFYGKKDGKYYNRTGREYDTSNNMYYDVKIGRTFSGLSTAAPDGWKRISDDPQASVDINKVIEYLKATKDSNINSVYHDFTVEYWELTDPDAVNHLAQYIEDTPATKTVSTNSLETSGIDSFNTGVINIRPLVSGLMDYRYDYYITIHWRVWDSSARKELLWSEDISNVMQRITVSFNGQEGYFSPNTISGWPETSAQTFTYIKNGTGMLKLNRAAVTGIPDTRIGNEVYYDLYKKGEGGKYYLVPGDNFQCNDIAKIKFDLIEPGMYCLKVKALIQDIKFNSQGKIDNSAGYKMRDLYGIEPEFGEAGVFYFKVTGPDIKYSSDVLRISDATGITPEQMRVLKLTDNTPTLVLAATSDSKNKLPRDITTKVNFKVYKKNGTRWDQVTSGLEVSSNENEMKLTLTKRGNLADGLYCIQTDTEFMNKHLLGDFETGNGIFCFYIGDAVPECSVHDYMDATCTDPKICKVCGATTGDPLPHNVEEHATCTKEGLCTICGAVVEAKVEHDYNEATCTEDAVCSVCGKVIEKAGHIFSYDKPECERCGAENPDYNPDGVKPMILKGNSLDIYVTNYSEYGGDDSGYVVIPIPADVRASLQHQYYFGGDVSYSVTFNAPFDTTNGNYSGKSVLSGTTYIGDAGVKEIRINVGTKHLETYKVIGYEVN